MCHIKDLEQHTLCVSQFLTFIPDNKSLKKTCMMSVDFFDLLSYSERICRGDIPPLWRSRSGSWTNLNKQRKTEHDGSIVMLLRSYHQVNPWPKCSSVVPWNIIIPFKHSFNLKVFKAMPYPDQLVLQCPLHTRNPFLRRIIGDNTASWTFQFKSFRGYDCRRKVKHSVSVKPKWWKYSRFPRLGKQKKGKLTFHLNPQGISS